MRIPTRLIMSAMLTLGAVAPSHALDKRVPYPNHAVAPAPVRVRSIMPYKKHKCPCNMCRIRAARKSCPKYPIRILPWLLSDSYCVRSPDHGWSPPQVRQLQYDGGTYLYYHNAPLPQQRQAAPMIYNATDTTQLGYSYRRVPTWQADFSRFPPVPRPSQWHNRNGGVGGRFCRTCPVVEQPTNMNVTPEPDQGVPPQPESGPTASRMPRRLR